MRAAIRWIYGYPFRDAMTGHRSFSHAFVRTFPANFWGFRIETEPSIRAVDRGMRITNVPIEYRDRLEGSVSKLDTVGDGLRVLAR